MDIAAFHTRRRFAVVESGRIAYSEDGAGPAALFVHGVPLNGFHWRHVIHRVRHRRRCIAVDLMGLGYSEISPTQDVSFTAQARMLGEVLDALGIDRVDLIATTAAEPSRRYSQHATRTGSHRSC
jgi:pimeloyl-ACP methyl ester carboxylesterase